MSTSRLLMVWSTPAGAVRPAVSGAGVLVLDHFADGLVTLADWLVSCASCGRECR